MAKCRRKSIYLFTTAKKRNSEARQNKNIDITLANIARNKKKQEIQ